MARTGVERQWGSRDEYLKNCKGLKDENPSRVIDMGRGEAVVTASR